MIDVKNLTTTKQLKKTRTYRPNRLKIGARKYSKSARYLVYSFVALVIVYSIYRLIFGSDRFTVKQLHLFGAVTYVNEGDLRNLVSGQVLGANMFSLDLDHISQIVQDNFLGVKSTRVEKDYPDTVRIIVEERVPIAVVCSSEEECFYIDKEGYVLGSAGESESELPRIEYTGEILIGRFLEENIIPVSFEILDYASKQDVKVSSMSYNPRYSELYIKSGPLVLIGHTKSKSDALRIVSSLLRKNAQEGRTIKKIDLRYDKVVVLYD